MPKGFALACMSMSELCFHFRKKFDDIFHLLLSIALTAYTDFTIETGNSSIYVEKALIMITMKGIQLRQLR